MDDKILATQLIAEVLVELGAKAKINIDSEDEEAWTQVSFRPDGMNIDFLLFIHVSLDKSYVKIFAYHPQSVPEALSASACILVNAVNQDCAVGHIELSGDRLMYRYTIPTGTITFGSDFILTLMSYVWQAFNERSSRAISALLSGKLLDEALSEFSEE
jgi:hypothetical protein